MAADTPDPAAIAAFLEALPPYIGGSVAMFTPAEMAAAVRRAAGGG